MEFVGFDWDEGNRRKCRKHGVSLKTIESLFTGAVAVLPDTGHSQKEQRFRADRVDENAAAGVRRVHLPGA